MNSKITNNIRNGDYFKHALSWYNQKYIYPTYERSIYMVMLFILTTMIVSFMLDVISMFPLSKQLEYAIETDGHTNMNAQITKIHTQGISDARAIAKVLASDYIVAAENYNYSQLKEQYNYIYNNSTRLIYKKFQLLMSLSNKKSPILLYQKTGRRKVTIIDSKIIGNNEVVIDFYTAGWSRNNVLNEQKQWQAKIRYEMDSIAPSRLGRFSFLVTQYDIKLIKDLIIKNK